jgi:hypothetical protein
MLVFIGFGINCSKFNEKSNLISKKKMFSVSKMNEVLNLALLKEKLKAPKEIS